MGWKERKKERKKRLSILISCVRKDTEMRSDKRATEPPRTDCSLICAIIVSIVYTGIMKECGHQGRGGGVPAGSEGRRGEGGAGQAEWRAG